MDKDIVLWIMGILIPIMLGLIVVLWKKQEKNIETLWKKVDNIEDDYKKRLEKLDHQMLDRFEKLKESIAASIEKLKEKNTQEMNGMRKDIETHSLARIDAEITELKKIRDEAYHHALETTKIIGDLRETIAIYQSLFVRREECSVCRSEK